MTLRFGALCAADPNRAAPQPNWLSLENPEVFARELTGAGFREVSIRPLTHEVTVESAEQFWDVTTRSSAPLVLLKDRLGVSEWERQSELALTFLRERLKEPGIARHHGVVGARTALTYGVSISVRSTGSHWN